MKQCTAKEIAAALGISRQAVDKRETRESWLYKEATGRGGKRRLYQINDLPADVQAALLAGQEPTVETPLTSAIAEELGNNVEPLFTYDRDNLWANYERKPEKQKAKAKLKLQAINSALALIENGIPKTKAWATAAKTYGFHKTTLYRWYNDVKKYDQADWLAALVPGYTGRTATAECSTEAWDFFKADYLRLEKPTASACYYRLKRAANEHGWQIPTLRTLERRIKTETPATIRVLKREGELALQQLYPAQQRTVRDLHALQWINGDGYQHNVFIKWPNGDIERPKTWVWQDIYSRKILAYRVDVTENTDQIRLSFGDLVETYGIPEHATIDNTRAAANKWMTGGVPNRYRFKIKEDDPLGLFPLLGIKVHWTSVLNGKGHGQAKPVERAFGIGGIGEVVDKHPAFAGAYTGHNTTAKPENYGSTAIPIELFLKILSEEITAHNAKEQRRTEICGGIQSYDQAFNASYKTATIRKATKEQRRLWLMTAEAIRVKPDGSLILEAGSAIGVGKNRYSSPALHEYGRHKIVVRFDPQNLHDTVHCYTLDGRYIDTAHCIEATGFGNTEAARSFNKHRKQFMRATKQAAKATTRMSTLEVAQRLPETEQPEPPEASVVHPLRADLKLGRPAPEATLTEEKQADIAAFQAEFEQEPAAVIAIEDPRQRYQRWVRLNNRIEAQETLNEQDQRFWKNYPRGDEYRSMKAFYNDFAESIEA